MGAGRGLWANELRANGADVIALDRTVAYKPYSKVSYGNPDMIAQYSDRTLMLCWPPRRNDMASRTLENYWRAGTMPYWLSGPARVHIQTLAKENKVSDPVPGEIILRDCEGTYRGLPWIHLSEKEGIITRTGMRGKNFPGAHFEMVSDLLVYQLKEEINLVSKGDSTPMDRPQMDSLICSFARSKDCLVANLCECWALGEVSVGAEYW